MTVEFDSWTHSTEFILYYVARILGLAVILHLAYSAHKSANLNAMTIIVTIVYYNCIIIVYYIKTCE